MQLPKKERSPAPRLTAKSSARYNRCHVMRSPMNPHPPNLWYFNKRNQRGSKWPLLLPVLLSLGAHGFVFWVKPIFDDDKSVTRIAVSFVETPSLLPTTETPQDGPDVPDPEDGDDAAPAAPPTPAASPTPTPTPTNKPEKKPDDKTPPVEDKKPTEQLPVEQPKDPTAPSNAPKLPTDGSTTEEQLAAQEKARKERDEAYRKWREEMLRRLAERNGKGDQEGQGDDKSGKDPNGTGSGKGTDNGKEGQGGAGAPVAVGKIGDPDKVYLCDANGIGREVVVNTQKSFTKWATVLPSATAPFRTSPNMGDYLEDSYIISSRSKEIDKYTGKKKLGSVEISLPADVLRFKNLDEPRGGSIGLGLLDGRCLIGFSWTGNSQLFPVTFHRVPAHIVTPEGVKVDALVDIRLFKNAAFEMTSVDRTVKLPFTEGFLNNSQEIARNIESHFQLARLGNIFAPLFGKKVPAPGLDGGSKKDPKKDPKQDAKNGVKPDDKAADPKKTDKNPKKKNQPTTPSNDSNGKANPTNADAIPSAKRKPEGG